MTVRASGKGEASRGKWPWDARLPAGTLRVVGTIPMSGVGQGSLHCTKGEIRVQRGSDWRPRGVRGAGGAEGSAVSGAGVPPGRAGVGGRARLSPSAQPHLWKPHFLSP